MRGMPGVTKRQLAIALSTAGEWHGDTGEGPVAMHSLSTTYTVHDETHRQRLMTEIKYDLMYLITDGWESHDGFKEWKKAIDRLLDLWYLVELCPMGTQWLEDREYMVLSDKLYDMGVL